MKTVIVIDTGNFVPQVCRHEASIAVLPFMGDPYKICIYCGHIIEDDTKEQSNSEGVKHEHERI